MIKKGIKGYSVSKNIFKFASPPKLKKWVSLILKLFFYLRDSTKGQLTRFMSQICESFNPVGVS